MLFGTLRASMLGNMLTGKGVLRAGKGTVTAGRGYNMDKNLFQLHTLSNIEITKDFNYEPRFNGVYSRDNLPKIKGDVYVINLNDKQSKGTHWVSLFIDKNTDVYFDSFGIKYIPQEVLSKIKTNPLYTIYLESKTMILS